MTNVKNEEPKCLLEPNQLFMIFVGLFIISVISYFVIKTPWIIIVTNHLGALGLTGLFAILAAKLATRKNKRPINIETINSTCVTNSCLHLCNIDVIPDVS